VAIPSVWYQCFIARRDAWGPTDGKRLYTGVINTRNSAGTWGFCTPQLYVGGSLFQGDSNGGQTRLYYDTRAPYFPKGDGVWPATWQEFAVSVDERNNMPGLIGSGKGYQDVNDNAATFPWVMGSGVARMNVQDNLVVDDSLYLPYDVGIDLTKSVLANSDEPVIPGTTTNVCEHGWDSTVDLRFGKTGYLSQTNNPIITLKRGEDPNAQYVRLRMIRGTARLQKIQ